MNQIKLLIPEIKDIYTQKNFEILRDYINDQSLLKGNFKFFSITVTGAQTGYKYTHNLGFVPKDVIQTSLTGAGALTWNYSSFDSTFLNLTTTGSVVFRGFIGTYSED